MKIVQERLAPDGYESRLPQALTGPLRAVVARMLEKDRSLRFRNCQEFLVSLDAALVEPAKIPVDSPPHPPKMDPPPMIGRQRSLSDCFAWDESACAAPGGGIVAWDRTNGDQVSITRLDLTHSAHFIAGVKRKVGRLAAFNAEALALPTVETFSEGCVLVERLPDGCVLGAALRRHGPVALKCSAPLLEEIAQAVDTAASAGIDARPLDQTILVGLTEESDVDWLQARPCVRLEWDGKTEAPVAPSLTAVPVTSTPVQAFAALVYFATGGRRVQDRSFYSGAGYIPIPGLNAASNHTLAKHLSGEAEPFDCRSFLRSLLRDEGLPASILQRTAKLARLEQGYPLPDPLREGAKPCETQTDENMPEIQPPPQSAVSRRHKPWFVSAAALLVLGVGGWAVWNRSGTKTDLNAPSKLATPSTNLAAIAALKEAGLMWDEATKTVKAATAKGKRIKDLESVSMVLEELRPVRIDLDGCDRLMSFDGIQEINSIQEISLNCVSKGPKLDDLDALAGLTSLKSLNLENCNELKDVEGLKKLTTLKHLNLRGCSNLVSLNAVANLTSLEFLDVRLCLKLRSWEFLKNLSRLKSLDVRDTGNEFPDLKDLTMLENLGAKMRYTNDFKAFLSFPSLKSLALAGCDRYLFGLEVLSSLKFLTSLEIEGAVQSTSGIERLTSLNILDLSRCRDLADVGTLEKLTGLQQLNLLNCLKISGASTTRLITALPKTRIRLPNGKETTPK
jgi:hypothetical protein